MHKLGQPLKSSALIEFHRDRRRRVLRSVSCDSMSE